MKSTPILLIAVLASLFLTVVQETPAADAVVRAYQGQPICEWVGRYLSQYQGKRLYEWDGSYLSKYQGKRLYEVDERGVASYQSRRLFTWDGEHISRYQGNRMLTVKGVVPLPVLALLAAGML